MKIAFYWGTYFEKKKYNIAYKEVKPSVRFWAKSYHC
jgi:hypothetical protein